MLDVIVKIALDRDKYWKLEWIFQAIWFILYSVFLAWIVFLIRPNERSQMLAEMHELNDTSTTHRGNGEMIEMSEMTPGRGQEKQRVIKKNGKKVI